MSWGIYQGDGNPRNWDDNQLPPPPAWRTFQDPIKTRGATYRPEKAEIELVNAALYLRRPLLITGKPGIGKSSLAYAVAYELKLGQVLEWSITTRSTLQEGLYHYDAIGRLQEAQMRLQEAQMRHMRGGEETQPTTDETQQPYIGNYLRLGPLGTALLPGQRPRVLLIDEIDKSDIDLPNDLLHVFEKGEFVIPELARLSEKSVDVMTYDDENNDENDERFTTRATIKQGRVRCTTFPFVVFTSNGEREFPPAFLRRCLQMTMQLPQEKKARKEKLLSIVRQHFAAHLEQHPDAAIEQRADPLIENFLARLDQGDTLATDQLLNAIYLLTQEVDSMGQTTLKETILKSLSG